MLEIDTLQSEPAALNGNPLSELRLNAVRAVLSAGFDDRDEDGLIQDDRRLALIRAEWLGVANEIGLPVGDVASWMTDDLILRQLIEAFDIKTRSRPHGLFVIR